jgi:hypothetical protein
VWQHDGQFDQNFLESPFAGKHPTKLTQKGTKAAAAEAAVKAAEATAVVDLEEAYRLAAEFEALGGGALALALAQDAEPGDPLRKCWLAHEQLRVSEARPINRAEILTARTDAAIEAAFDSRFRVFFALIPTAPKFEAGRWLILIGSAAPEGRAGSQPVNQPCRLNKFLS